MFRFPANTTEACIINKILHCRQAEKEKLTEERDTIFQENKIISQDNQRVIQRNKVLESCVDTLQLELSSKVVSILIVYFAFSIEEER